jgi:ubiquinone/menaquinone biosynthesis C-methylase UbiE
MVDGVAERLPLPDASVDAVVLAGVLCSVPDPGRVLDEAARVLRPGGELRFYEHVVARNRRLARLQRLFDATFWPRLFGGCHASRDTEATLVASRFTLETRDRWSFRPTLLATPVAPRILGRARREAAQPAQR